jgi:UDP-N-acetylmuramoyl-L-alanyl-D-glutamate--2,6-diaminopimelate ligase
VLDGWAAPPPDIPYLRVAHVRRALGTVAARFHHHPDRDLILIGVVGSSGRQELSWMIHHLLDSRDFPAGLINTKAIFLGRDRELPCLVTPEAAELFATLRAMREANCHLGVMEVPTSGIVRERMTCVGFHILVYHGHDDHGLPQDESEEMLNAKFELFLNPPGPPPDIAVVNRDDEYARPLLQRLPVSTRAITYGRHPDAHISARQIEDTDDGIYFRLIWPGGQTSIRLPWRSPPALKSTLGSLAVAFAKGHDLNHIASYVPGFAELRQGRMSSTVPQMHWTF